MRTAIIAVAALCLGVWVGRFFAPPAIQVHPCPGSTFIGNGTLIKDAKIEGPLTIIGAHAYVVSCYFQYRQRHGVDLDNATDARMAGNYFDLTAIR